MTSGPAPATVAPRSAGAAYHEKIAHEWDAYYQSGGFRRRAELIRELLEPVVRAGTHWLDAGCGSGYFSRELARRGASVVGLDGSSAMIESATRRAAAEGMEDAIRLLVVDTVERIDFPANSFDGVICLSVIEYVPDPEGMLRELARVTRPGSPLIISAPNSRSLVRNSQQLAAGAARLLGRDVFTYLKVSKNAYSRGNLARLLQASGFAVRGTRGFDPLMPRFLWDFLPGSLIFAAATRAGSAQG